MNLTTIEGLTAHFVEIKGLMFIFDDEGLALYNAHSWNLSMNAGKYFYLVWSKTLGYKTRKTIRFHRELLGAGDNDLVDHVNGNTLDNRRANLRICNRSQNASNSATPIRNTSGFKGVTFNKREKKWKSAIRSNGRCFYVGSFDRAEDAHIAYCLKAQELHQEFARFS